MARKSPPKTNRVTIRDVARKADVSITTVSFVLNDAEGASISVDTRKRVLAAAAELKYRPNAAAATLRTNRTHSIGFITDHIAASAFAGDVIHGAQQAAWEAGQLLTIINTGNDDSVAAAAIAMLIERRVDGILYSTLAHRIVEPPDIIREVPAVLLNCADPDGRYPSVVPDEIQGGRLAANALLEAGHRRIGFLNFHNTNEFAGGYPPGQGRLAGYRQALDHHGVPFDPDLVIQAGFEVQDGYRAAQTLLDRHPDLTALFCGNDRMAMGAYYALAEAGLRIPDDVSVCGFDDQQLISTSLQPALSTVALPFAGLGRAAVHHLRAHGAAPGLADQLQLPCTFVSRHSIAAAPLANTATRGRKEAGIP